MSLENIPYHRRPDIKARRKKNFSKWYQANKQHILDQGAKRRVEKRAMCLIANARTRSRRRGVEFGLDFFVGELQRRIDNGVCELTGVKIDLSPGRKWNSPSIDRIDPKGGYLPGNVRMVCQAMNLAMGDWGEDIVWELFQGWSSYRKRKRS